MGLLQSKEQYIPFLDDEQTVEYLNSSKTLFLLYCSGQENSALAERILKKYPGKAVICSASRCLQVEKADEGEEPTSCSKKKALKQAQECSESVQEHCSKGVQIIIVDDIRGTLEDIQKYGAIGREFNYVGLVENLSSLEAKSEADVKEQKTLLFPLFYGWFVNEVDSKRYRSLGQEVYERCLGNVQFREEFVKHLLPVPGQKEPDPSNYFSSADYIVGPLLLHCTAFFSNHGDVIQSADYAARKAVKSNYGKVCNLSIIGLLITPRSIGFRLELSDEELPLWLEDSSGDGTGTSVDGDYIISPYSPTCGTGSRAHFSLGSGPGVDPVETGLDLVQIIQLEQQAARYEGKGFTCIGLDGNMACGYGNGNWMVHFQTPLSVDALFSSYY